MIDFSSYRNVSATHQLSKVWARYSVRGSDLRGGDFSTGHLGKDHDCVCGFARILSIGLPQSMSL